MILWYHQISQNLKKKKIDFMISKNRICDITKSWRFFGITFFFIYLKIDLFYTKTIRFIFWYHKIDFVISKIDLLILNLILWYHKVGVLLCIEVSFRILSITTFNCQRSKAQASNKKLFVCCTPTYPLLTLLPQTFFGTSGKNIFWPHFHQKITIFPLRSNVRKNKYAKTFFPTYLPNQKI